MKFKVREWTCLDLYKRRNKITFPVYQRGVVWSERKNQLLIDSILRGIDIPKLYLQKTEQGWDCIDGQQRIRAIVGFFDEDYSYEGNTFSRMTLLEQETIENYRLTITEVEEISEEDVRLLFTRLQLGVPLNSGEKLNAIMSSLGDFVKEMARTPFMVNVSIPKRRFAKEQVCAQICNNSLVLKGIQEDFRNSKYEDLAILYRALKDFDLKSQKAEWIRGVLHKLDAIFGEGATEIRNRAAIVSIYLLVEELLNNKELEGIEKKLKRFYLGFLKALSKESRLGMDATNRFLINYQSRVIQAADSRTSIRERHEKLKEAFRFFLETGKIIGYS